MPTRSSTSDELTHLRAGPLAVDFVAGDLRRLSLAGRVVVSRIYVGVRDQSWRLIPGTLRDLVIADHGTSFRVDYVADHVSDQADGSVQFTNHVTIVGESNGRIRLAMEGTAQADFLRNRLGFCVLHPQDCAGAWVRIEHADGSRSESRFPDLIAPHQPFLDIAAITTRPWAGAEVTVRLAGEVFEMEDQRNWGDASFKTYSTPLARPRPVAVPAGTVIAQQVDITLTGRAGPALAAEIAPGLHPPAVVAALRRCRLDRLRLVLTAADPIDRAAQARALSEALDLPIDAVLIGDPAHPGRLDALASLRLASLVALPEDGSVTPAAWVDHLRARRPDLAIGGGSDLYFTDINRDPSQVGAWPILAIPVDPYVHATDAISLQENLPAFGAITTAARKLTRADLHLSLNQARHRDQDELVKRHAGTLGGQWLAGVLSQLEGIAVLSCGPTTGAMGLVAVDGRLTPAAEVLAGR